MNFVELSDGLSMDCIGQFEGMSIDVVYIPGKNVKPLVKHLECDEFLYVLDGELEIIVDSTSHICQKGDYVCVPKGVVHGSINNSEQQVKLMAICSPPYKLEYEHKI